MVAVLHAWAPGLIAEAGAEPLRTVQVPGSYGDAMRWYERSAKAGNARAQFYLGMLYLEGQRGKPDPKAAAEWLGKAAAQGHYQAQLKLGLMHYEGQGVVQNFEAAAALFEKASARSSQAAYNLALMLERGQGGAKDPARALVLFEKAVARGIKEAALHLAVLYGQDDKKPGDKKPGDKKPGDEKTGEAKPPAENDTPAEKNAPAKNEPPAISDVPQDKLKALMWFTWAQEKGLTPDPAFRARLIEGMSEADIVKATKLALERLKN